MADQALQSNEAVTSSSAGRSTDAVRPEPPAPPTQRTAVPAHRAEPAAGLPLGPRHFVGRRTELQSLRAEIVRPGLSARGSAPASGSRVLLVAGRPGSGRTALALQLAHQLANRYPDGQLYARLTAPRGGPQPLLRGGRSRLPEGGQGEHLSAEQVARDFLRVLGARTLPASGAEEVTGALRRALSGRRVLLVLDDVADAEQLLPLLPSEPGCLVIATARGPLTAVADVRPCVLGGLDSAAAVALLTHDVGSTRIVCDPRAAEDLAEECGHHPAALRMVACWLAARPRTSVADAVRMLRERASDRDKGPSAPLTRAFRLVYDELSPAAARTLRLLVLAPTGAVDAQIASALAGCSVRDARSTLVHLADAALLHRAAADGEYLLPGCLEGVLQDLLEATDRPGEVRLARARMLERTVRLLTSCRAALEGERSAADMRTPDPGSVAPRFRSRSAAAQWLSGRLPTLLAAARAAVADGSLDTLARRLIAALVRTLSVPEAGTVPGAFEAALYQLHGLVLDVARRRGLYREQAAALISLADLDSAAGRRAEALDRYRAALAAARKDDDTAVAARVLESLGDTYRELDDPQRAADWYGRALALLQIRGGLADQARLHGYLGALHLRTGQWEQGVRQWRAAAGLYRRTEDLPAQTRALGEAARAMEYAGRSEDALRTGREALRCARMCEDVTLEAAVLLRMADTLERLDDAGGARAQRAQAARLLGAPEGGVE